MSLDIAQIESLIKQTTHFKETIAKATRAYRLLPQLLEKEQKAIQAGLLFEAESALYEKESLTSTIEESFESISQMSDELLQKYGQRGQNISEIIQIFSQFARDSESNLAGQVLMHQVKTLEVEAAELIKTARIAKPLIEANRLLMSKMMENYNQSYKFWQEIKEQVEGSYTAEGTQKIIGRHHGFQVRA